MAYSYTERKRIRKSFGSRDSVLEVPYLLQMQKDAYTAFLQADIGPGRASVVAYLALATAFGGEAFRLIGAIGIIALGLALTVGGLAQRLARKSPPPSVPPAAPTA